jgi:hypothetical protein
VVALLAAGCGGSDKPAASSAQNGNDRTKLSACMKQHGIDLPDRPAGGQGGTPGPDQASGAPSPAGGPRLPEGVTQEEFQAAIKACGGFRGSGAGRRPGGRVDAKAVRSYVACVERHGYAMPTPNTSGKGPVLDQSKVDRTDPAFVKANAQCERLLGPPAAAQPSATPAQQ